MKRKKVIVIGAGASGLMAAGRAAETGSEVLLLEKMKLPGRKIGISGKGRCNLTNTAEIRDFISHFGKNGRFLHQPFSCFFSHDLIAFFTQLGLKLVTERGGRVFPACGKAVEVVKTLEKWVKKSGCRIKTSCTVTGISVQDGKVTHVKTKSHKYPCDAVILATGGASYPRTGSTGDGYVFAKSLGHNITPLLPALVPLTTAIPIPSEMDGLLLKNIQLRLFVAGKKKSSHFGDMQFTSTGFAGPVVLTISNEAVQAIEKKKTVKILIDLKPALSDEKLGNRLQRDFIKRHKESLQQVLGGLLPRSMIAFCLKQTALSPELPANAITSKDRKALINWIKNVPVDISGYGEIEDAIVTAGGVALKEVNPKTMESKMVEGLYITGELLNLHGDTGGYNLQAAFSTGWVAGQSVSLNTDINQN